MSYRQFFMTLAFVALGSTAALGMLVIDIGDCVSGQCTAFDDSGNGHVTATIDIVNVDDIQIVLTNNLNNDATNDDPFVQFLGFQYDGTLSGLSLDGFTVNIGAVGTKTPFLIVPGMDFGGGRTTDFSFDFQTDKNSPVGDGRFQIGEQTTILVETTGSVDLSKFTLGVAKIGAVGGNGSNSVTLATSVPEPSSFLLLGLVASVCGAFYRRETLVELIENVVTRS